MLEHIAGRPSVAWRRNQTILFLAFWVWRLSRGDAAGPRFLWIRRFNRFLTRFTPWQLIITTLSAVYAFKNADIVLGLGSPEPLANLYSPDFYRATWVTTAVDTGFATAQSIQPKFLRDIMSIVFFIYYLFYAREADEKLRRYRATCTVEVLRTTWNKTSNPYLRAITYFSRPRVPVVRKLLLARPPGSLYTKPIACMLFFSRSPRELAWTSEIIFDLPGGGFIAMGPEHHEERLRQWTIQTGRPVISLDYGKAPEYPFPWALNEAFDVYRVLAESNGRAVGMSGRPISIVVSGDSAGANLSVGLMCKIIESAQPNSTHTLAPIEPLPHPTALVMAYAALDFNFTSWMTREHLDVLRTEHRTRTKSLSNTTSAALLGTTDVEHATANTNPAKATRARQHSTNNLRALKRLAEQKDHLSHKSPLAVVKDTRPTARRRTHSIDNGTASRGAGSSHGSSSTSGPSPKTDIEVGPASGVGVDDDVVMGVRRKTSWTRSLSGTFKSLAGPLSPVVPLPKRSSKEKKLARHSDAAALLTPPAPGSATPRASKVSKDTPFKSRLRDRVGELGNLEVNTDVLSASPAALTEESSTTTGGNGDGARTTGLGGDADDEDEDDYGFDEEHDDDDDEDDALADVPEGEREYYPLAEKDKPLSARVLFPTEDETRNVFQPNVDPHTVPAHPPRTSATPTSSAVEASNVHKGRVELERVRKLEREFAVADSEARQTQTQQSEKHVTVAGTTPRPAGPKKVPIGTRLTMTSRAGFFQDRIVSPSMMRAMAILYIGPKRNPDFQKDYYLSPILTPAHLLAEFPPILMVCGEKDPFVDDTVIFGGRIREAKRARRSELLRQPGARESLLRATPPSSSSSSSSDPHRPLVGLRGDEARLARDRILLSQEEDDWVEMRILEGWGHGFLQMTSGVMLGKAAANVIDEMAEWIGDAFASGRIVQRPKTGTGNSNSEGQATTAAATSSSTSTQTKINVNGNERRPSAPTKASSRLANVAPSSSATDTPPPRRPTNSPPKRTSPPSPHKLPSPGKSSPRARAADGLPPVASSETETETEKEGPLTFVARRGSGNQTPRNSFGASAQQSPRRYLHSTSSSSNDTIAVFASSPGTSPEDVKKQLQSQSSPLVPTTTLVGGVGLGGGALLTEGELMRRRRVDAVFGMGESDPLEDEESSSPLK